MTNNNSNNTGLWMRWALGILVIVLIGTFAGLTSAVLVNGQGVVANRVGLTSIEARLLRIEQKQDQIINIVTKE